MDLMSVLGLLLVAVLIVFGMAGGYTMNGALSNFWEAAPFAIVFGGTLSALLVIFPVKVFTELPKVVKKAFSKESEYDDPERFVGVLVDAAYEARRNSKLTLEGRYDGETNDFLRRGIQYAVDLQDPRQIRAMMEGELINMAGRHKSAADFFNKGALLAPGFGMLGTLTGLINLLARSPSTGSSAGNMILALLAAFYGLLLANVVFMPVAGRLRRRSEEELLCKQIIIEGVIAIVNEESPKNLEERLYSYIPPSMRR
jgi:chemotaxis protein MotA